MTRRVASLLCALALASCSSSDSGAPLSTTSGTFDGEKSPYGAWTRTTELSYDLSILGTSRPVTGRDRGEKTVGGKTYRRAVIGDPAKPDKGAEFWIDATPTKVTLAGIDVNTILGPPFTATLDAPVTVELLPTPGAPQAASGGAKITSEADPAGKPISVTGSYTLVDADASVETTVGTIGGCAHYKGAFTPTGAATPPEYVGKQVQGELWYHPSHGIVAVKSGDVMLDMGMTESKDCHTPTSAGYSLVRKVGVLDSKHPHFTLNTYDCAGDFDADKDTHAKMLLELRWAEDAKAKGSNPVGPPFVTLDFGTMLGTYPAQLVESPVSVLHPEENGKGYRFYIAYVDQAARNQATNGISYKVGAKVDQGFSPIRASARIYYKKFR